MAQEQKLKARFDIKPNMEVVEELGLGDNVTLVLKGKVVSMRGAEQSLEPDYSKVGIEASATKKVKRVYPGSVELELSSVRLALDSEFSTMVDEDE